MLNKNFKINSCYHIGIMAQKTPIGLNLSSNCVESMEKYPVHLFSETFLG